MEILKIETKNPFQKITINNTGKIASKIFFYNHCWRPQIIL